MTEFDPKHVPPFPVVNVTLLEDDTVTVDGRTVQLDLDDSPKDAALRAAAARCAELGLSSVRVRAVGPDGIHLMVVTSDGEVYALGEEAPKGSLVPSSRKRNRILGVALGSAVAIVLAGTVAGAVALTSAQPAPTPTVASTPGAGSNLPVVAPPGYAQEAAWAVSVDDTVEPILLSSEKVAFVNADSRLQIRDAASGQTVWQAQGRLNIRSGIHATTVAGVPVLATHSSNELTVWPLDYDGEGTVPAVTYPFSSSAEVTYLGSTPLIDLGYQTVQVMREDGFLQLDVPVTATPFLATDTEVVAFSDTSIWHIPFDGAPYEQLLAVPEGATGVPRGLTAAGVGRAAVLWDSETPSTQIAALISLDGGAILAATAVSSSAVDDQDAPAYSVDADTMAIGSLYLNYGQDPVIIEIEEVSAAVINGDTIYGISSGEAVTASRSGDSFTIAPFTRSAVNDDTLPSAVTDGYAFVVTQKVDDALLYALPREN